MGKSRFIFFTKTNWQEPPRIRHQLARLLINAGHEVVFFEKPNMLWQSKKACGQQVKGMSFFRYKELLHHKLRLFRLLYLANSIFVVNEIKKCIRRMDVKTSDIVVNFNYEYGFLRKIFPENKLITLINDDFWSRALMGYSKPLTDALELTCASSDAVLTVSNPLVRQLSTYCKPILFLPWADEPYRSPSESQITQRKILLFWGYINDRIDFKFVSELADKFALSHPDIKILFAGPIEAGNKQIAKMRLKPNMEFVGECSLDDLPLDRVLAGFMPFRRNCPNIEAGMLPNKALKLLAKGLPLLIRGMPEFIDKPFVFRMESVDERNIVESVANQFNPLQSTIQNFVESNTPSQRLPAFMELI